jgi:flagellar basal-body rod protein FlgF
MQGANFVLTSYQDGLTRAMDVVANNIANSNTTGFKRQEMGFESLIDRPANDPMQELVFAVDRGSYRDAGQGPLMTTGNDLDIAIQGAGYFPIQTKNGTRYTRAGSFQLNQEGEIVTVSGDKLLGDGDQPITVPDDATEISIAGDGTVNAVQQGNRLELGRVKVVKFDNEQAMQYVGDNQYTTNQQPTQDMDSHLVQGMLEQSNVQSVTEMTHMIAIMRSYQMAVHLVDLDNQRLTNAISRLSKTSA